MDEYTSVVDRTVAQIGSHALARTVRARGQKFIAITCHEDVEPWLNPDWVYRPDTGCFTWRLLQRRPAVALQICRVGREAWALFKNHHYLSTELAPAAVCFGAFWRERLVAFSAWIGSLTRQGGKREHRTVTTASSIFLVAARFFSISNSYSLERSIFIARSRFLCCERSFWQLATMPVATWVMRTAESVVLTCWPPRPPERYVSTRRSSGLISI